MFYMFLTCMQAFFAMLFMTSSKKNYFDKKDLVFSGLYLFGWWESEKNVFFLNNVIYVFIHFIKDFMVLK